jgi:hypothetical protein
MQPADRPDVHGLRRPASRHGRAAAGGRFVSEAEWGQPGGFMFTACPAGYKPNVRFSVENKEAIGLSLYNCVGGKPNS